MALTEEHRLKIEGKTKEEAIQEAKDLIKAAARYERLNAQKDFQDMLADMSRVKELHESEVKGWSEQLEGTSFFKSIRIVEVIKVNQIRANQLNEALNYIPKLLKAADDARMFLRAVTEEEQNNGTRN